MIEELNKKQRGWDTVILFKICKFKDINNISSRRKIEIKIDLE
jgi:hypothetical protein